MYCFFRTEFKIDLIVWKFDINKLIDKVLKEFKIDLIVWKSGKIVKNSIECMMV